MKRSDFAKIAFDWEAFDYQLKPINDESRKILMACGRQVGKATYLIPTHDLPQ